MSRIVVVVAFALVLPAEAFAQAHRPCEPRVEVGAAVGLMTVDIPVDIGREGIAKGTGTGLEGAIRGLVPVSEKWRVRAEAGFGSMGVVLERNASGESVRLPTGDDVSVRWLSIGLEGHREGIWSCLYTSVGLGAYRYEFRGTMLTAPGVTAVMGLEVPAGRSGAWFVEVGVNVALTRLRPPVAASLAANLRPAVGWLYRF